VTAVLLKEEAAAYGGVARLCMYDVFRLVVIELYLSCYCYNVLSRSGHKSPCSKYYVITPCCVQCECDTEVPVTVVRDIITLSIATTTPLVI
jgi:hypothetical protein